MIVKVQYNDKEPKEPKGNKLGVFLIIFSLVIAFIILKDTNTTESAITENNDKNIIKNTKHVIETNTNKIKIKPLVTAQNHKKEIYRIISLIMSTRLDFVKNKYELTLTDTKYQELYDTLININKAETTTLRNIAIEMIQNEESINESDNIKFKNKLIERNNILNDEFHNEILKICEDNGITVNTEEYFDEEYQLNFTRYHFSY